MQIAIVNSQKTIRQFHQVPHLIYKDDPNWACPLEAMVDNIFSPEKNPSFKNGDATRWVLTDDNGKPIGRIGAFFNRDKAFVF